MVGGAGGFSKPRDAFAPEEGSVEVDEGDDAEGQCGVLQRKPRQARARECSAGAGEGAGEGAFGAHVVVDLDREVFARRAQGKVESDIDV